MLLLVDSVSQSASLARLQFIKLLNAHKTVIGYYIRTDWLTVHNHNYGYLGFHFRGSSGS